LTVTGADVALHEPFVTVTLNVPGDVTVIDCVVVPFDQRYDDAAFAVSVTLLPAQNVVGPLAVMLAIGVLSMVMVWLSEPLQPLPSVTVTLYVPEVVTLIVCVVAPVDQR
jgi:hypothetical protein